MQAASLETQILDATGRMQRVRSASERHHANATATWQGGNHAFGVVVRRKGEEFMGGAADAVCLSVAMCVANAPGIAKGVVGLCVHGQPVNVLTDVTPDASGWAVFDVEVAEVADANA